MGTMFEQMMQSAAEAAYVKPSRPAAPPAQPSPNYPALIDVLTGLYQVPDGLGETVLHPEEAATIPRSGFCAPAGCTWVLPCAAG